MLELEHMCKKEENIEKKRLVIVPLCYLHDYQAPAQ